MKHQKVLTKFLNPNDWQPGRYQSKCDQPRPRSLLKLFKWQNGLFHTTFFLFLDSSECFHSDFCGCFQRRSTLILYMHFFFSISAQVAQNTKCILVSQIVLELSLLYVALHIFFFFSCAHMQFVKNWQSCSGHKFSSVQIHSMYPRQFSNLYFSQFFLLVECM